MFTKVLAVSGTALICAVLLFTSAVTAPRLSLLAQQDNQAKENPKTEAEPPEIRVAPPPAIGGGQRKTSEYVSALLREAHEGGATVLSEGDSYDDFASVAETSDGTIYVAYAAYYDGHDQIRLHKRMEKGDWSTRTNVPLVRGAADIWMPQLAVDARDRLWVIWCEQTGQTPQNSGNWDLYARSLHGAQWGPIIRLTDNPKPDINPHVFTDADRRIHIVWQAHPENNGDIQYCRFDGENWSRPLAVTSDTESDWYPHGTVDANGTVWIAFDSYRNGDYDVMLTSVTGSKLGPVVPIASSSFYEAHPSIAATPDGALWVAWEQGGYNWGKDQGHWLQREKRNQGTALGSVRHVKVACYKDGQVLAAPDIANALPKDGRNQSTALAELACGPDGRLWLRCRHLVRGQKRPNGTFTRGWTENVTSLTERGWEPFVELPSSTGRISVFSRIAALKDGGLMVAYSSDARAIDNFHRPIQDTALTIRLDKPTADPGVPSMAAYEAPSAPAGMREWNSAQEFREVQAIRKFRVTINGDSHQIVRGDLHRHTELSWDVGPANDGSFLDFYRYMIDVASMDFGSLTDHQGGGHYAYSWWLTEKSADLYHLAPRFVPLYGYERSVSFPHGHRNVFHATRGVPIFTFQIPTNQRGVFPGVGANTVLDNDTKLLYEFLHGSGGISIPHTSATSTMGTDWRDNDPAVEPVVEMYQGARNSSETLDAPRVHPQDEAPDKAPGGFQKSGLVWNAYAKGYRLGTVTASDHGSTHISYAIVYTPKNERAAILESIRRRQTYGATANMILDFQANGHFMGDEFTTKDKPDLVLRATGTGKITDARLIRNNEYIYTTSPGKAEVEIKFTDRDPKPGTNMYYFRLLQEDGEVAWSSPIWINGL